MLPVPHSQEIIRVRTHRSKQFSASRKVNRRVRPFSSLPENPIKLQGRILIDVDIGNWSHFRNSKIFLGRMHSQRPNSSSIFGVKLFLVLGEMIEDGIRDTRCKDDGVAIQHKSIVSLEAIMSVKAIKLHNSLGDGTIRVHKLNVILIIEEVFLYLCYL